ncbi:hypothetical protein FHR99_002002 [Litorivivens lipolytica]|uniref:Uncharacterized protein n=1 Tax=Litorivivens lipolytica TaxID=1524264 RepID=A0A7W4W5A4_9GAMM|nr:hypothetical protein [Litorivivens lipolytica]
MNSIIERMRAEKVARRYEDEYKRKHPAATAKRLREYA